MEYSATTLNLASIHRTSRAACARKGSDRLERDAFYLRAIKRSGKPRGECARRKWASDTATKSRWLVRICRFFPIVYYGILKTGAAVVPICILFKPREVEYHLRDSDAKVDFYV